MDKKEVNELKRRLTRDGVTFSKFCGCYVNSEKEKVLNFSETFLGLEDDVLLKYIEIAKKVFSGNIGDNLLTLDYETSMEGEGTPHRALMALRDSSLSAQPLVDVFFDKVIESYGYAGNYLILLFADAYDVITKTKDNLKLDESEEVFKYILCAICPVELAKPALGYLADEGRIGSRIRDWVVGMPDTGFMFPAFNERSTDIHSVLFYTKDTKDPHRELMTDVLGVAAGNTATQKQTVFKNIIRHAIEDEEASEKVSLDIYEKLTEITSDEETKEPVILTSGELKNIIKDNGVSDAEGDRILSGFEENFGEDLPEAAYLIDKKAVKTLEANARENELKEEIALLKNEVDYHRSVSGENTENTTDITEFDVIMHVKPTKVSQIHTEVVDGRRCVVVPLQDGEEFCINGVRTK
ncbi:MAG: DUF4317 domain-containing protein [Lachnospiraceae bacterium]|nr:DUF4317 domain-containing protein [Lachnospiraceae bacterium]